MFGSICLSWWIFSCSFVYTKTVEIGQARLGARLCLKWSSARMFQSLENGTDWGHAVERVALQTFSNNLHERLEMHLSLKSSKTCESQCLPGQKLNWCLKWFSITQQICSEVFSCHYTESWLAFPRYSLQLNDGGSALPEPGSAGTNFCWF